MLFDELGKELARNPHILGNLRGIVRVCVLRKGDPLGEWCAVLLPDEHACLWQNRIRHVDYTLDSMCNRWRPRWAEIMLIRQTTSYIEPTNATICDDGGYRFAQS